jgi:hypothetical protein
MGRVFSFITALAMTIGGGYLLAVQIFGGRWHGILLLTGASMLSLGLGWLWVDFVSPNREEG